MRVDRTRVFLLLLAVILALVSLGGRLFWIQALQGEELARRAEAVRSRRIPVEARRGVIYDARGRELALSVTSETVVVNPSEIRDPRRTAALLAPILGRREEEIYSLLIRRSAFEYLERKIPPEEARAVKALRLRGVYVTQETRRVYPKGMLLANVLGFTGLDNQGLAGLEAYYDRELRGKPGAIVVEYDARNRELPQAVHRYEPPVQGWGLSLTVDETIQYILERELEGVMARSQARGAMALVMDPHTGDLLALGQRPSFDPNLAMDYLIRGRAEGRPHARQELWRLHLVSDAYPPGSIFKPLTAVMAIEEGQVTPRTPFFDSGSLVVPGSVIQNWNGVGLGSTDFAEAFKFSANTIFARVGLGVGREKFYRYLDLFGLLAPTGVDLPGEGENIFPPEKEATPLDLALMSFGQTLSLTPLHLARAVAAIANGGYLVRPRLVRALLDEEGRAVRTFPPEKKRIFSEATARTVRELMAQVVDEGTGKRAKVSGYSIGGKTGTAQKVIGGRVVTDRHIASFVGFAPLENPRVLVLVMVDEPTGIPYGGYVAAPVFEAIVRDTLRYLQVPPDRPEELPERREPFLVRVPNLLNLPRREAEELASLQGFSLRLEGGGQVVTEQSPPPEARVPPGTPILARAGSLPPGEWVTVPDLRGRTFREVAAILGEMGLGFEGWGTGVASSQDPPPGTRVRQGSRVKVNFSPPPQEGL